MPDTRPSEPGRSGQDRPAPARPSPERAPRIVSVQAGKVAPLGPGRVPSGFVKHTVEGDAVIRADGLEGDEQADLSVHGDADKAIYGYAMASYDLWRASHPMHAALLRPGGMAENLTIEGMAEEEVCIGDVMQVGSVVLQVTQPREPCFKFALRFGDSGMPKAMIRNGRSGWYYRVLQPGIVRSGDPVSVAARLNPSWSIARMNQFIHAKRRSAVETEELLSLPGLAETWIARLKRVS